MNRLIITSRLAVLFLVIILSISLNDRGNASGQIKSGSKTVPQVMEPGLLKVTPAREAIEQAREDNINKLMRTGSEDLMVSDYPAATLVYRKLEHMNTTNIDYKENLAYALLGMNQKVQALQVLHNAFYYKGNTLYTSGRDIRAYATYALLEDEAGNWKEAVLAYQLAGADGQPDSYVKKTDNDGCPNIDLVFSIDTPEPTLLAAAAHAVIGNALSSPPIHINGRDGYDHAYDPAIAQLERAVSLAPKWSTGWLYLGLELQNAHRYQQALNAFNQSIKDAGKNKIVVMQIERVMMWRVRKLIDVQHKAAHTGASAPAPAH